MRLLYRNFRHSISRGSNNSVSYNNFYLKNVYLFLLGTYMTWLWLIRRKLRNCSDMRGKKIGLQTSIWFNSPCILFLIFKPFSKHDSNWRCSFYILYWYSCLCWKRVYQKQWHPWKYFISVSSCLCHLFSILDKLHLFVNAFFFFISLRTFKMQS